jgi:hypothetical protein
MDEKRLTLTAMEQREHTRLVELAIKNRGRLDEYDTRRLLLLDERAYGPRGGGAA